MRAVNRKHPTLLIYVVGIELPKGYGLFGYDHCKASQPKPLLCGYYTNELVKSLDKYWPDAKFQTGMSVTKGVLRGDSSGRFSGKKISRDMSCPV
jgi:hypothetical protein